MKATLITIILLISNLSLCYGLGYQYDWISSFEQNTEDWTFYDVGYTDVYYTEKPVVEGDYAIGFCFPENSECKEVLFASYDFPPDYFKLLLSPGTTLEYYWHCGTQRAELIVKLELFEWLDPDRETYLIYSFTNIEYGNYRYNEVDLYDLVKSEYGSEIAQSLCLKRIEVYLTIKEKYAFDLLLDNFRANDVWYLNPPTDDYCQLYLGVNEGSFEPGEQLDITVQLYYGYPSQVVDIYWAVMKVETEQLFFFPDWIHIEVPIRPDMVGVNWLSI